MTNRAFGGLILLFLAGAAVFGPRTAPDLDCKDGKCYPKRPAPVKPTPPPAPTPPPQPKPRPWGDEIVEPVGSPTEGGKVSPDGSTELSADLLESEKFRNQGGRDGAGL